MINKLLKKSWNPLLFRVLSLGGLIFFIFIFYFGSIKLFFNFTNNWVMFLIWTLWWPFLYLSLLFFGRVWCGFLCPMGLVNEIGNKYGFNKKNYLAKYSFLPFFILFAIIFWEQISGLFFSTNLTLIFLLTFLFGAFIIGIILPRWSFCKYFCPVGTILGVFSRLSFIGIRTDRRKCSECTTKECILGGKVPACPMFNNVPSISGNQNCLLCTNCIKNCPHESAKLSFVIPGNELKKKDKFYLAESLFIISLLAFSVLLTSMGTRFGRKVFSFLNLEGIFLRLGDFIFWIAFFILIYSFLTYLVTKLMKNNFKENLINGGYVFLPLTFFVMFFQIVFGFITPLIEFPLIFISISKYVLVFIGVFWSVYLAISLFHKNSWPYVLGVLIMGFSFLLVLISGPLSLIKIDLNVHYAQNGETIVMDAFSMGFNPDIIYANEGDSIKIKVTSKDIAHAFDIDKFDTHMSFKAGDTMNFNFKNLTKGEYIYYCSLPGHREAGMEGKLIVE